MTRTHSIAPSPLRTSAPPREIAPHAAPCRPHSPFRAFHGPSPSAPSAPLRAPTPPRIRSAFTLIEILLAIAVFSIVLAAITGVFFAALRLRNKTADRLEQSLPIQQTLTVIKHDLAGLRIPGSPLGGTFQTTQLTGRSLVDAVGQRVSPDLYTNTGQIDETSPFSEIQKVAYFLAIPTNQTPGFDLIRTVSRNLLPVTIQEFEPQRLLTGVHSMALYYFDGLQWLDTWDSTVTSNLPSAIRVLIDLNPPQAGNSQPPPVELVVPILAQAATNTTETTTGGGG